MVKRVFVVLVAAYCCYSCLVYAYSASPVNPPAAAATAGFEIWQEKNCQACHQLYGLGGYMGPDLTNIMSDKNKGRLYTGAFVKAGSARMPNFNLSDAEVNNVLAFLAWVDKSGESRVPADKVNSFGNYNLENH